MEIPMRHFPVEEWTDFVRQGTRTTRKEKMREHLEQGCERCSKTLSLWQRVRQTAGPETNYTPPGEAVRIARVFFADSKLTKERGRSDSLAELLFDSVLRPILEGIRSSGIGTRQMLYRARPFQIDLLIEPQASGQNVVVTGFTPFRARQP
jgi:hypothetical protein